MLSKVNCVKLGALGIVGPQGKVEISLICGSHWKLVKDLLIWGLHKGHYELMCAKTTELRLKWTFIQTLLILIDNGLMVDKNLKDLLRVPQRS